MFELLKALQGRDATEEIIQRWVYSWTSTPIENSPAIARWVVIKVRTTSRVMSFSFWDKDKLDVRARELAWNMAERVDRDPTFKAEVEDYIRAQLESIPSVAGAQKRASRSSDAMSEVLPVLDAAIGANELREG
jgi:hypothetical protein